jgi:hypothetical protein
MYWIYLAHSQHVRCQLDRPLFSAASVTTAWSEQSSTSCPADPPLAVRQYPGPPHHLKHVSMQYAVWELVMKSNHSEQWNAAVCTLTLWALWLLMAGRSRFVARTLKLRLLVGQPYASTQEVLGSNTVDTFQDSEVQRSMYFPKSRSHPKFLNAKRMISSKFLTEDPNILGAPM